jgi:membrane-associated HD superfamily phosphohydrolase
LKSFPFFDTSVVTSSTECHKNKIFVAMSDDEEDTGRSYRNFSDTSHKKYDSRKSYFDSEKLGDGKSLKIEIKSRSDQSGSDKKRTHMHSVDDVTTEVSKKGKDFNKKRSEKDDSHSVVESSTECICVLFLSLPD